MRDQLAIEVLADTESVSRRAATFLAAELCAAVKERGRACLAVSGGTTPWRMLRLLAHEDVPWEAVHLFQVDERVAPAGDPERNLTGITDSLLAHATLPVANVHPMAVDARELEEAAARYARSLQEVAGTPVVLDLVHLGLGPDGHTASLLPGDAALHVADQEVALAGPYQGRRRMTLTLPVLNRARRILWMVIGADRAAALVRLMAHDEGIPAGRVRREGALLIADRAAAGSCSLGSKRSA